MAKQGNTRSPGKRLINRNITRRDFTGGMLLGAGASLLGMAAPSAVWGVAPPPSRPNWPPRGMGPEWTGPGGLGDYANSNGNTHQVVNSAHGIAQGLYKPLPKDAVDTGEVYDVVAIGGGFAGLSAGYTTMIESKSSCLILDNHPIFGGEGKMNIFEVDGQRLCAPQGSNDFLLPNEFSRQVGLLHPYWDQLGLPSKFDFVSTSPRLVGKINVARDNFGPQIHQMTEASQAHYYFSEDRKGGQWARNPWENSFRDAPIPDAQKAELMRFAYESAIPKQAPREGWDAWLDTMSYKDYIEKVMGYSPQMTDYVSPVGALGAFAFSADAFSAYGAYHFVYPGMVGYYGLPGRELLEKVEFGTFPGGNAGIARYFVKAIFPTAISGGENYTDIHNGKINFTELDKPGSQVRMRLSSTGVYVKHDGHPDTAKTLTVAYEKGGTVYTVKARSVVMCGGGWVNKYICQDLSPEILKAYDQFNHGPMLTVNIAVRNWRFMEKLGASAVRWFNGEMGFWVNIRQPMKMADGSTAPLDPDKPVILSTYIAFPSPGYDAKTQGVMGRTRLFSMSYADIEAWVIQHYTQLFADYGFDAQRDIAGIITNRWGHAYVCPGPGFYFDRNGLRSPMNTVQAGYGRVSFGHSETSGRQMWSEGVEQGRRATMQALAKL